jgi:hypothetical protein
MQRHVLEGAAASSFVRDRARFARSGAEIPLFAVIRLILLTNHNGGTQLVQPQQRTPGAPGHARPTQGSRNLDPRATVWNRA